MTATVHTPLSRLDRLVDETASELGVDVVDLVDGPKKPIVVDGRQMASFMARYGLSMPDRSVADRLGWATSTHRRYRLEGHRRYLSDVDFYLSVCRVVERLGLS